MKSFGCVFAERLHSIEVKGRLEHAITGAEIPGWKSKDDVECYIDVDMGDYVVYNDWVGQVRPCLSRLYLRLTDAALRSSRYASYTVRVRTFKLT